MSTSTTTADNWIVAAIVGATALFVVGGIGAAAAVTTSRRQRTAGAFATRGLTEEIFRKKHAFTDSVPIIAEGVRQWAHAEKLQLPPDVTDQDIVVVTLAMQRNGSRNPEDDAIRALIEGTRELDIEAWDA